MKLMSANRPTHCLHELVLGSNLPDNMYAAFAEV